MTRTARIATLVLLVLAGQLAAAQPPAKVARVGVLSLGFAEPSATLEAFVQGLRDLGYVEGRNLAIEYRWAEGKLESLPPLASELARLRVDVIVTAGGTQTVLAAKNATNTIPIVMVGAADPVRTGLVASLARPGGNITGLSSLATDLSGKRLELLKETMPKVSRVAILWNSANVAMTHRFREAQVAARMLGLILLSLEVQGDPADFEGAFSAIPRERPEALLVVLDAFTLAHRKRIVELAAKNHLPMMGEGRAFVDAGGLMSYGPNALDIFRRAATFVDKILKGAQPANLPVEQPTRIEFVINLKTAKALGLKIPPSVLIRADHVIQ